MLRAEMKTVDETPGEWKGDTYQCICCLVEKYRIGFPANITNLVCKCCLDKMRFGHCRLIERSKGRHSCANKSEE